MRASEWQVWDERGRRKYLTEAETQRFLSATVAMDNRRRAFCLVVAYTGCRVSEALLLTKGQIAPGVITLSTLKRRRPVFRQLQVPIWLTDQLLELGNDCGDDDRLWRAHRATAWRWIKQAMNFAAIAGACASPKGLRHGFGMRAAHAQTPPNLIQRWLGHASPETTMIYLDACGAEERAFAERAWP